MQVPPPRYKQMRTDQDWTDVWPSAATFKWSVVPFPARQGYPGVCVNVLHFSDEIVIQVVAYGCVTVV